MFSVKISNSLIFTQESLIISSCNNSVNYIDIELSSYCSIIPSKADVIGSNLDLEPGTLPTGWVPVASILNLYHIKSPHYSSSLTICLLLHHPIWSLSLDDTTKLIPEPVPAMCVPGVYTLVPWHSKGLHHRFFFFFFFTSLYLSSMFVVGFEL